jgi:PKD repeat protein
VVKEDYITVHEAPPIAEFSADPKTGSVPLTVHLSDLSTGTPGTWAWTFGDGGTSDLQNPEYIYDTVGIYNVTLRVANALGNSTLTKNGYIDVKSPGAPVAAFTASPLSGALPLTVYFTDESTGESTTWLWDFGDDVTSGEKDPVHTYTKGGHFSVRLTAANSAGESTVEKPDLIYITGSPSPTRTPFIPVTTPVTPVVPIESPATPVEPIETSATPVVPIETPVTPVEPIETSTTPVVPIETPVTPVEPIETPVNPSPGPGGVMWVVSNPGSAAIYVDGEYMGTTLPFPLVKVITVASGLHEIMMAYEGYQPWTGTVDLSSLFPVLVYGELTPIV